MTIKDLQINKLKLRKDDPFRASVYSNIIDGAKKIAKEENREVDNSDIIKYVRRSIKSLTSTIEQVGTGEVVENYKKEVEILNEFMPKEADESLVAAKIDSILSTIENPSIKNMGMIMKQLKEEFGDSFNAGKASNLVKSMLV